ncbi:MAG: acetolactate synthase 2 catalytic subunit [Planctomycetota bacterium]|jgi:acetolactate synthase-1/2/3 large subunit
MNGAQVLIRELEAQGVTTIFGYPGGAIMPVYDALTESRMQHVLVRHEQAAALAAGGYARATGRTGVCMATSGPGATNLVTGIADAFLDSVPLVAITGQVPTPVLGTDAFQEVDIFGITMPVVKHSYLVRRGRDLPAVIREAFHIASSGRPGPVLIDLPKDVAASISPVAAEAEATEDLAPQASAEDLEHAAMMIARSRRPVLYAGGGIVRSRAVDAFRAYAEASRIPTVTSLNGIGTLPTGHPLLLGMLGMHGSKAANQAVQDADLLICMGARFDDRATGKLASFAPMASVIHMDIDPAELGKLRMPTLALRGDLKNSLERLPLRAPACREWLRTCTQNRERHAARYDAPGPGVYAPALIRELTSRNPAGWTITCDVGQHQMWVAQHGHFARPEQHISSGGLGTMGFGLPAAIGVKLAQPDQDVLAISGDGSFMMNLQELATIRRYGLGIKILLLDNSGLGLVRQWQECFFDRRYSEVDLSDNPDFGKVAESFGIPGRRLDKASDCEAALEWLGSQAGPALLHVCIDTAANVWPLVPPNQSNSTMIEEVPCSANSK